MKLISEDTLVDWNVLKAMRSKTDTYYVTFIFIQNCGSDIYYIIYKEIHPCRFSTRVIYKLDPD